MIHDYDKDLTLAVSGTGVFDADNVGDNIFDFVLGAQEARHCTLVIPLMSKMTANMKQFTEWAIDSGFDDFVFVKSENAPMTPKISGLSKNPEVTVQYLTVPTDRDAVQQMLSILEDAKDDAKDYAFAMMYNPESTYDRHATPPSDYEILGEAKFLEWLPTYNICEGMVDSFEGYESAEEKEARLKAEAEFAAKQAQESPVAPRKRAARKTAAKKTTAPKTEAPKAVSGLDKLIAEAVQKDKAHVHKFVWADDDNGHEGSVCIDCGADEEDVRGDEKVQVFERDLGNGYVEAVQILNGKEQSSGPMAKTELSATVPLKSYAQKDAENTQDLWNDVQAARSRATTDSAKRMVPLVKQLAGNIQDLTNAFNAALTTMTEMLEVLENES